MKKVLYFLMLITLVCMFVICGSAEEGVTVVYLETGADGNGLSDNSPVGSLGKAVELLDKTKDCTIVVCGRFEQAANFAYPETFDGKIKITSVHDGMDYRKYGAVYECIGARFVCSGEFVFDDIDIVITGKYMFVIANHYPFTLGEGVTVKSTNAGFDGKTFGTSFSILGNYQSGQPKLRGSKDAPEAENSLDTNITVLGGSNINIGAYSRLIDGASYLGTANVTIGGNAHVSRLYLTPCNKPFTSGKTVVTIDGNAKVDEIFGASASGFAESFTVNWLGGTIGKYADVFSEGSDLFLTYGKTLVYSDKTKAAANFETVSSFFDNVTTEGEESSEPQITEVKLTIGQKVGYVNGEAKELDAAPIIRNGRTMLPVRFVADSFGAVVLWNGATSTATVKTDDVEIKIVINSPVAFVNGEDVLLDSPAFIENGRTYLPVRFVADKLGAKVEWDGATSTATLTKAVGAVVDMPEILPTAGDLKINTIDMLNNEKPSADSHGGFSSHSSVEMNFRQYVEVTPDILMTTGAMYPRVKQMSDGRYIMFYQNAQIGSNIYYTTSEDALKWSRGELLFKLHAAKGVNGESDSIRYSTCDGFVLANGDILAVASYRYNLGYGKDASMGGLVIRRSTDNGKTWTEEEEIYKGINWEPFMTQTADGEVQIFFTHNAPKFYLDGKLDKDYLSSGVGMLRSVDNGKTWTPSVTGAPYSAAVVMQQKRKVDSAKTLFTDQMPAVAHLNNGTSVMAVESRPDAGELYISFGYSSDNWTAPLDTEEEGPVKRADNVFLGAAPYILQFDSGETLLTYNVNNRMQLRVGDENGENFGATYMPFLNGGYWGTVEKRTSHSAIAAIANTGDTNTLMVGTVYLNHAIKAEKTAITVDGNNKDWQGSEALFVGSSTQAQSAIRAAVNGDRLYLLLERSDYSLTAGDSITLYFAEEGKSGFYRVKVGLNSVSEVVYSGETLQKHDAKEIGFASVAVDKLGAVTELSIPMSYFTSKNILFTATLYNKDDGTSVISDAMGNNVLSSTANWPIIIAE
ncbi:MAG: hypothetical protein E7598_01030 [Ruminococcaceae bacterium]|nr:hypothetical protein [Oscillospiraceae bacterium]